MPEPLHAHAITVSNCECCGGVVIYLHDEGGEVFARAGLPQKVAGDFAAELARASAIAKAIQRGASQVGHG